VQLDKIKNRQIDIRKQNDMQISLQIDIHAEEQELVAIQRKRDEMLEERIQLYYTGQGVDNIVTTREKELADIQKERDRIQKELADIQKERDRIQIDIDELSIEKSDLETLKMGCSLLYVLC